MCTPHQLTPNTSSGARALEVRVGLEVRSPGQPTRVVLVVHVERGPVPPRLVDQRPELVEEARELFTGLEDRRLRRPGQHRRRVEGHPAVAAGRRATTGELRVAADPDRRVRLARGLRVRGDAAGREVAALVAHLVAGEDRVDHVERLVEERVALVEVDAERRVLRAQVARRGPEDETPLGEHIDRRDRLRQHEGVAIGQHDDVRHQLDALGDGGAEGERREGIESVVPAAVEPLLGGRGMIGEAEGVEARALRRLGEADHAPLLEQLRVIGMRDQRVGDRESHASISSRSSPVQERSSRP